MKYRDLGTTGLTVSEVGFGVWTVSTGWWGKIEEAQGVDLLVKAFDHGVNLFDTGDTYGLGYGEEILAKALKGQRHDIVISTKFGYDFYTHQEREGHTERPQDFSPEFIRYACEQSLRRLDTDYIDLYQMHRPDPATPIEETLRALDDLVRQGKVRYIGCSNFEAWQIVEAAWTSDASGIARFTSAQPEYSLVNRQIEAQVLPVCGRYGLGILPYFPLAHGFLTGKYRRDEELPPGARLTLSESARERRLTASNFDLLERLAAFTGERGHTVIELAFAWLLAHSEVSSVIAGASTPQQLEQNAAAAGWTLSDADVSEIEGLMNAAA